MRETRTRLITFFVGMLILAAAPSASVTAQESDKEKNKTTTSSSTLDAWRQALPTEAETEKPAEESAKVASRASRVEIEKNLLTLERKWMEALKLRDASTLSQIISDDFTFVSPRLAGAGGDRTKYFDHALRDLKLASYEFEELKVQLYGRAAVVSGRLKQVALVAGDDWGGTYLITDVWIIHDGTWRAVSRHSSLLPKQK